MKKPLSAFLLSLLFSAQAFAGAPSIPPSAPTDGRITGYNSRLRIIGNATPYANNVAGVAQPGTSRTIYTSRGGLTRVKLAVVSHVSASSAETPAANAQIQRASIEYPLGTTPRNFTVAGKATWSLDGTTAITWTDELGVAIPPGGQFAIRFYERFPAPATSSGATVSAGGALTSGTTYYYKITNIDQTGVESATATEVSATPASTNLSVTLAWTNATFSSGYRIYRGTASGAETFLTQIAGPASGWVDNGSIGPVAGNPPPSFAARAVFLRAHLLPGEGYSNDSLDYTGVSTALAQTMAVDTANYTGGVYAIAGDDPSVISVIAEGDSIIGGGMIPFNAAGASGKGADVGNWFDVGLRSNAQISTLNVAVPGAKLSDLTTNALAATARLSMMQFGDVILSQLGRNDLSSQTWQQIAANQLLLARQVYLSGRRYYLATLIPAPASTDWFTTLANQTGYFYDAPVRFPYNAWIRAGSPVDSGGAPNMAGSPSPYVSGYFDAAASVEVNSSGSSSPTGGLWPAATKAYASVVLTGTPSLTSLPASAQNWTAHALVNALVKFTSGAASGSYGIVSDNTTNSLTLYAGGASVGNASAPAPSATPATGDTFDIYAVSTIDGTHPVAAHQTIGAAFGTWAAANLHR